MKSNPTPRDTSPGASDDDRIQVAQLLSEAASHGRLTLDEYEARLTKAYGAVGYDELERLTYDLPEAMEFRRGKSKPAPSTMLMAILSGFERRGRWYVPGRMTTFTLFGGGVVDRLGMPVDPGNLLFLGSLGATPVIGLPGCTRSPALNGADWVLERIACGLAVTDDDIAAMGVGGLLKEIALRGQLRETP